MANDITLILFGALCFYFVYCAFLYFEIVKNNRQKQNQTNKLTKKPPEIGAFYTKKSDPWGDSLVVVLDIRENYIKYAFYCKHIGIYGKSTMQIKYFLCIYKIHENQNIEIKGK
jgi:hypothetical protein